MRASAGGAVRPAGRRVVAAAVALQDRADAVILGCARPGETSCEVARHGRVVAGHYSRLSGWAADLAGTGLGPPARELRELEARLRARVGRSTGQAGGSGR
ncbi:hypothetical protein [Saccharothrix sp. Mg75]|uniref:hypothetical protein n=1 Tax=Saccharothrix sp. Mg75 TaxID=3445357 RepID=UPI003EE8E18C